MNTQIRSRDMAIDEKAFTKAYASDNKFPSSVKELAKFVEDYEAAKSVEEPEEYTKSREEMLAGWPETGQPDDIRGMEAVCSILEQYELSYGDTVSLRDAKAFVASTRERESGCLQDSEDKKSCASKLAENEQQEDIGKLAIKHGLMDSPTAFAHRNKIEQALRAISDEGKSDAGIGFGGFDFWIKLDGIEYYFNAKPKINEIEDAGRS